MEKNMVINLIKWSTQTFSFMDQQITPELFFAGTTLDKEETFRHLGTVFDSKLSKKKHVEYLTDRLIKILPIRKAGCLWGCARSTLTVTHKKYNLPILTNCCEPLITISETLLQKIEVFLNLTLRFISGAPKTYHLIATYWY